MRLAVVASNRHPLREPYAGGQENLTAALVRGLRQRGHEVVLYAPAGTDMRLADELVPYLELPSLSAISALDAQLPEPAFLADQHALASAMSDLGSRDVDVVLNHCLHQQPLLASPHLSAPVLTTLHTPPFPWLELGSSLAAPTSRYVAVSRALADSWAFLADRLQVIPNGIDTSAFPLGGGGADLAWVGRITPEKGTHVAFAAARAAGRSLVIAGPIADPTYFAEAVQPFLSPHVDYAGHLRQADVAASCSAAPRCW